MIGVLSDAHGNIDAFRLAIRHLRKLGATSFYFLGDSVGYIPSLAVVSELRSMGNEVKCILGNHEKMLLDFSINTINEPVYQHQFLRENITKIQSNFLRSWPTHIHESIDGINILFVHGGPSNFTHEYVYPDSDFRKFNVTDRYVFMGHSHYPFIRNYRDTTFVNVGSCGLPRDDGRYGAFALYDPLHNQVKVHRYKISIPSMINNQPFSRVVHASVIKLFNRRLESIEMSIIE